MNVRAKIRCTAVHNTDIGQTVSFTPISTEDGGFNDILTDVKTGNRSWNLYIDNGATAIGLFEVGKEYCMSFSDTEMATTTETATATTN